MTDMTEADGGPQTNGFEEEDDRSKMRPADIDADMKEMERRKRVEMIMSSRLFREELERIIELQMKDGNGPAGLLQQISDMMGIQSGKLQSTNFFKSSNCVVPINDIRGVESMGYAKGEKILRCKLAALYRLMDLYGWTQNIHNHITARLNQEQENFLVNPFGMLYHEITASSLVKVDMQGQVVESGTTNFGVNVSGFQLHAAVHSARPDIKCIIHLHTPSVLAVSSLKCGLLPLSQESVVIGDVSYHPYLGSLNEPEEKEKLARDLGPMNKVMFLTNHGVVCCGESIEEAFYNVYNTVLACETQLKLMPVGIENLQLIPDETRKQIYDTARNAPEITIPTSSQIDKKEKRVRIGCLEFEALMRMLDNAGFRTGYIYRQPLVKGDPPRPRNDVEVPPAVSSLGYLLEEEEMYKHGNWKKYVDGRKTNDRTRWLNSPNVYQKVEILETGTPDPKKITKWVEANADEWVADGSPQHSSTPVKIESALQFVPKNTNPKEFKKLQQLIKENRRADKITSGPQSHILEGVSWEEAKKLQDANISQTGDQVILVGAASKGIIQRGFQHNATVYKTPYAKNPFDAVSDQELEDYKKVVTRKQKGESSYEEDQSESEAHSYSALPTAGIKSPASETEEESREEPRVLRIETKQVPRPSQAEVVLSEDACDNNIGSSIQEVDWSSQVAFRYPNLSQSFPQLITVSSKCLNPSMPKTVTLPRSGYSAAETHSFEVSKARCNLSEGRMNIENIHNPFGYSKLSSHSLHSTNQLKNKIALAKQNFFKHEFSNGKSNNSLTIIDSSNNSISKLKELNVCKSMLDSALTYEKVCFNEADSADEFWHVDSENSGQIKFESDCNSLLTNWVLLPPPNDKSDHNELEGYGHSSPGDKLLLSPANDESDHNELEGDGNSSPGDRLLLSPANVESDHNELEGNGNSSPGEKLLLSPANDESDPNELEGDGNSSPGGRLLLSPANDESDHNELEGDCNSSPGDRLLLLPENDKSEHNEHESDSNSSPEDRLLLSPENDESDHHELENDSNSSPGDRLLWFPANNESDHNELKGDGNRSPGDRLLLSKVNDKSYHSKLEGDGNRSYGDRILLSPANGPSKDIPSSFLASNKSGQANFASLSINYSSNQRNSLCVRSCYDPITFVNCNYKEEQNSLLQNVPQILKFLNRSNNLLSVITLKDLSINHLNMNINLCDRHCFIKEKYNPEIQISSERILSNSIDKTIESNRNEFELGKVNVTSQQHVGTKCHDFPNIIVGTINKSLINKLRHCNGKVDVHKNHKPKGKIFDKNAVDSIIVENSDVEQSCYTILPTMVLPINIEFVKILKEDKIHSCSKYLKLDETLQAMPASIFDANMDHLQKDIPQHSFDCHLNEFIGCQFENGCDESVNFIIEVDREPYYKLADSMFSSSSPEPSSENIDYEIVFPINKPTYNTCDDNYCDNEGHFLELNNSYQNNIKIYNKSNIDSKMPTFLVFDNSKPVKYENRLSLKLIKDNSNDADNCIILHEGVSDRNPHTLDKSQQSTLLSNCVNNGKFNFDNAAKIKNTLDDKYLKNHVLLYSLNSNNKRGVKNINHKIEIHTLTVDIPNFVDNSSFCAQSTLNANQILPSKTFDSQSNLSTDYGNISFESIVNKKNEEGCIRNKCSVNDSKCNKNVIESQYIEKDSVYINEQELSHNSDIEQSYISGNAVDEDISFVINLKQISTVSNAEFKVPSEKDTFGNPADTHSTNNFNLKYDCQYSIINSKIPFSLLPIPEISEDD